MEKRRRITLLVLPAEGVGPSLEEPQLQIPEQSFERHAQPTQHAASPAQLIQGGEERDGVRGEGENRMRTGEKSEDKTAK